MKTAAIIAALAATSLNVASARARPPRENPVTGALDPIRQTHHLPGMAGAIVTSDGVEALGVAGVRKAGTDVVVMADDQWQLGSDTKAMTAVLIASLVERGRLTWDTTIGQVFPDIPAGVSPAFRQITLLQLLSHQAGLQPDLDWQAVSAGAPSVRDARRAVVRLAASLALSSTPGTKYEYANLGYVIAGTMAEEVTGKSWEALMQEVVFAPLGMTSAGFGATGTAGQIDQPWPHTANGPFPTNGPESDNPAVLGPAGEVHCSMADWAKFVADQLRGSRGAAALLKPASYTRLRTAPPLGGATPSEGTYAFGWALVQRPWGGGTVYTHSGSNRKNWATVSMAPARDFAVLFATNQGDPEAQAASGEVIDALVRLHGHR
jgi:CubicO group peptidase (beta-lactamase class C family)